MHAVIHIIATIIMNAYPLISALLFTVVIRFCFSNESEYLTNRVLAQVDGGRNTALKLSKSLGMAYIGPVSICCHLSD